MRMPSNFNKYILYKNKNVCRYVLKLLITLDYNELGKLFNIQKFKIYILINSAYVNFMKCNPNSSDLNNNNKEIQILITLEFLHSIEEAQVFSELVYLKYFIFIQQNIKIIYFS